MHNPTTPLQFLKPPDFHALHEAGAENRVRTLVLACALLAAHSVNLWLLATGRTDALFALIVHVLLAGGACALARRAMRQGQDARFLWVLAGATACISVFGAGGVILCIALHAFYERRATPFADWFRSLFPQYAPTEAERIYDDIVTGRDESAKSYTVIPFIDVLQAGGEAEKREALSKMLARYDARFTPAFRKALTDTSNSVRVQAATALARIENDFLAQLMRLLEVQKLHPEEPAVLMALAEHYDAYAFTGILDADRERTNRAQALAHYQAYLARKPEDSAARVRAGRLLLRDGRAQEAVALLKPPVESGSEDPSLLAWYAEALYEAREYTALRMVALKYPSLIEASGSLSPALAECLTLWSGFAAPGAISVSGGPP